MSILGRGFEYSPYFKSKSGVLVPAGPPVYNLMPQHGVDFVAGLIRGSGPTPISNWYLGLFENNYVPNASVTAADLPGVVGETTAYSEASRPEWNHDYDGVSTIDNADSLAAFNFTSTKILYGAFVVSTSTKGGNTGTIISIARFDSPIEVPANTEFVLGGVLNLVPIGD